MKQIEDLRKSRDPLKKTEEVPEEEIRVIKEALRDPCYAGYIRYLIYAFCSGKVTAAKGSGTECTCELCGKQIMYWNEWRAVTKANPGFPEKETRNHLAYGSDLTKTVLCLDCLMLLRSASSEV